MDFGNVVPVARNRRAGEVERAAVSVRHDLYDALRGEVLRAPDRSNRSGHRPAGVVLQLLRELLDERGVDERFVSLYVHENVVIVEVASEEVARGACDAVRPARKLRRSHHRLASVLLDGLHDALVVSRDEHLVESARLLHGLHDPRHERFAREHGERLAGEAA